MLDIKFLRANIALVKDAVAKKGVDLDVDRIVTLDGLIRRALPEVEGLRQERKALSREFAQAGDEAKARLSARSHEMAASIANIEAGLGDWQQELQSLMLLTPNIPDPSAPVGPDAESNVVVKTVGKPRTFDFTPLDHVDLLVKNGWAELGRAADVSGSRTYALKGPLMRLELALANFALDRLAIEGFTPITAPPFARERAFIGTGHFPLGKEEAYELQDDDLFLIGTSEVFLNSLHADEILDEAALPVMYAGYSPCYRREAGSGGRDVRGLLRVHHFTKVEQYIICRDDPEELRHWHEKLLGISEAILNELELPYQIVECCTGDMGLGKIRMHDVETWVPSLNTYRETHSCSTLHDWQARRTNTRWRSSDKSLRFVHTLNNTAIATPRIFAPLLENHQRADGSVALPKAIRPYMGGRETL